MPKYLCTTEVFDGETRIATHDVRSDDLAMVWTRAIAWGRGVLRRMSEPEAYAVYTMRETKADLPPRAGEE